MLLYLFIIVTIYLSYWRARQGQAGWETFWVEPGFLVALIHYGYLEGVFDVTYAQFFLGWVLPCLAACLVAVCIGFWLNRRTNRT